jgi:hypothetical protein
VKKYSSQIFLFLGLLINASSYSQSCCPYVTIPLKIVPDSPTDIDSVKIITTVTLSTQGNKLQSNFEIDNDTIKIKSCYSSSPLTVAPTILNTLKIGQLYTGKYIIHFFASINDSSNSCTYKNGQSRIDSFSVSMVSSLFEISKASFSLQISPNPVSSILHINTLEKNYEIEVFDLTGKLYLNNISKHELDVSTFPKGIYLLRLKNEKSSVVKKFMKE